ncbi:hypothetical protein [Actinobacillus equuli]|nr:hypothetical protein [Actinobacillus equuli]WGE44755.1 hypothetical protein NYR65_01560 [Actinobacillus equuli subsp. equuli]
MKSTFRGTLAKASITKSTYCGKSLHFSGYSLSYSGVYSVFGALF